MLQMKRWGLMIACLMLMLAALACAANAVNMTVGGVPKYICPSSTPKPTDVMPPANPPTYPAAFQANLDYSYVDPNRSIVSIQYAAQNVGWVIASWSGIDQTGQVWPGSNGQDYLVYTGNTSPGVYGSLPIVIPMNVVSAQIFVSSQGGSLSFSVIRLQAPLSSIPASPPYGLPAPIYPTPRPTYTPYPTPTLFQMVAPTDTFFLDDPIYNYAPPIQLRLRMKSPIVEGSFPVFPIFTAATWNMEIDNVGSVEFDFLGGLETYVSEVKFDDGTHRTGVWSPSHLAATFLNIQEQAYYPRAVMPGDSVQVKVAAWIPATSHVVKLSFVQNTPHAGDPGYATFAPGQGNVITWQNAKNTICAGEITYP